MNRNVQMNQNPESHPLLRQRRPSLEKKKRAATKKKASKQVIYVERPIAGGIIWHI
jgi:hypothetical protein